MHGLQALRIALADRTGVRLDETITSLQQIKDRIHQIASAAEEQSVTSETISESMDRISNITRQSADGMNGLTDALRKQVYHFRMEETAPATNGADPLGGAGYRLHVLVG